MEIYDCTLREGEQSAGASFSLEDRVELFRRLDEFGFDYVELGWPSVLASSDVLDSFKRCKEIQKRAKISAFGSTSMTSNAELDPNINFLIKSKADLACIFGKTWLEHVVKQLKITPQENLDKISSSVNHIVKNGMPVFYDAEHYFDGFKFDRDYALKTLESAAIGGAERLVLCDTNGGTMPDDAKEIVKITSDYLTSKKISGKLGVHYHDDCGLALANTLASLQFIEQVQGTINGIGERIGNLNFSTFLPVYLKKLNQNLNVNLKQLKELNEEAYRLSGTEVAEIRPFVGDTSFAHKGGVHIDAVRKGASYEHIQPEEIGNKRVPLLTTLGGTAGIINIAELFGYNLDKKSPETIEKAKKLFEELRDLEKKGYRLGGLPSEQYLLISKYFGDNSEFFNIEKWDCRTKKFNDLEESEFFVRCNIKGIPIGEMLEIRGGPVDAAYKTLREVLSGTYPQVRKLELVDFHTGIARRNKEESTVRTMIEFQNSERFKTIGVDTNIIQSAIEAIVKGFNYHLLRCQKS